MVKQLLKISVAGLFFIVAFGLTLFAQVSDEYPSLNKYHKFSFVTGPVLYNSAQIYPQYGNYSFQNFPIVGFNSGFEFDLYPEKKWSIITGFLVALEPTLNVQYKVLQKDLYPHFTEDWEDKINSYAMVSFSAPLLVKMNIQLSKSFFANFSTGYKAMYFPPGGGITTLTIHNEDDSESREIFGINVESQKNLIYGSYVGGAGVTLATSWGLLKANLIYVINFQNTIEGEYQFANLLTSPPTKGKYELSGNYLGLIFSFNQKKKHQ